MAKAEIVPPVPVQREVVLRLTEDEAYAVSALLGSCKTVAGGGIPETNNVFNALLVIDIKGYQRFHVPTSIEIQRKADA